MSDLMTSTAGSTATLHKTSSKMGPDEILLEGYAEMATYRSLMAYMSRTLLLVHD
jgi:hypothetical protein